MFVTNLVPLDLIYQLYAKNRHAWPTDRAKKAECILASILRKVLVVGVCDLTYRDKRGSLERLEHATMNSVEICKTLGITDADPEPVSQAELIRNDLTIRYFDLDKKKWGELNFDDIGVFILERELKGYFSDKDGGIGALKSFIGDDWPTED